MIRAKRKTPAKKQQRPATVRLDPSDLARRKMGKMPKPKRPTMAKGGAMKKKGYAKGGAAVSNKDMAMALQILMKKLGMKPPK